MGILQLATCGGNAGPYYENLMKLLQSMHGVRGEEILNLSSFRRFSMSLKSVAKDIDTGKQVSIRAK